MAITGPASFVPTSNLFIAHWNSANDARDVGNPLVLKGGVTVADLTALRDTLLSQRAGVEAASNGREEARANLEAMKAQLLNWLNRFNAKLDASAENPKWLAMRPGAFGQGEGMGKVIRPLDDLEDLWGRYDEEVSPPIVLLDGTTQVDFATALGQLKGLYAAYSAAENGLSLARAVRNETQEKIRPILVLYRKTIPTAFAEGSAIYETMPRYSPLPGHTPEPVVLSGVFNAETGEAELSWTISEDAKLEEYEVRAVAGPEYDAEDDSVIDSIPAGAERVWQGAFGLGVPGAMACFRVYVTTSTGNERASNTITLMRPTE